MRTITRAMLASLDAGGLRDSCIENHDVCPHCGACRDCGPCDCDQSLDADPEACGCGGCEEV